MPSQDESSVIQVPVDSDVRQVLLNTRVVVDDMYMQQGGAFLIGADNIICSHPGKGMPKISRLCTTLHLSADTIITWKKIWIKMPIWIFLSKKLMAEKQYGLVPPPPFHLAGTNHNYDHTIRAHYYKSISPARTHALSIVVHGVLYA